MDHKAITLLADKVHTVSKFAAAVRILQKTVKLYRINLFIVS